MLRRFVPLFAALALSIFVLLARLWDVQVVQHDVWATEAANIVRKYGVEPYTRGTIRDRNGVPLVRDEKRYVLEFVWRDFRRGHPLGQVAMLRSLALARPVGLDEAQRDLSTAASHYARLTPRQLEEFAKGQELDVGIDYVPAIAADNESKRRAQARRDRRSSRAGDIRFYVQRLLGLTPREVKSIRERIDRDRKFADLAFLQLAAVVRGESTSDVDARLTRDVRIREEQLLRLAQLIVWDPDADASTGRLSGLDRAASPGDRLVRLIEERRRDVENDTADALFRIALGFSPTRLDESNLARIDLSWLGSALEWDATRLAEWRASRGNAFVNTTRAGFVIARAKPPEDSLMRDSGNRAGDRIVSSLAHAFRADADEWESANNMPDDWRRVDEFAVLSTLPDRLEFGVVIPDGIQRGVFPFQSGELRNAPEENEELLRLLFESAREPSAAAKLVKVAGSGTEWDAEDADLVAALLGELHERAQSRIADVLDLAIAEQLRKDEELPSRAVVGPPWIERAKDTRRYVVRDRGARPKRVGEEPSFELVLLVTRYHEEFAGFRARATTRRVPVTLGPDGRQVVASKLIGKVRSPRLVDVLRQRPQSERLVQLQRKRELREEDAAEILQIVDAIRRSGEAVGGSGLESWLDDELSGKSGYLEVLGLQDVVEGNREAIRRRSVDGLDVLLTIDARLQFAAEDVLSNPDMPPPGDRKVDEHWFRTPVGAIVLTTVDGEILAAASVPLDPRDEPDPLDPWYEAFSIRDGEALNAYERTLTRPRAQAPGSVVKPFLAAYALQNLGLDPRSGFVYCEPSATKPRQGVKPKDSAMPGYGQVNCNTKYGHSRFVPSRLLDLDEALKRSCNVYFAALAERSYDSRSIREAYRTFGFGSPTGVRYDDNGDRSGLVDSFHHNPASPLSDSRPIDAATEVDRQFLGNGLAKVDANVVQVARAYAGLATGELPEMRLVRRIGDEEVVRRTRALGISEDNLEIVRDSLVKVVHDADGGTAYEAGLRENELGFRLAAKTGSADYLPGKVPKLDRRGDPISEYDPEGMRKHTWLAGWFPEDQPRYVVVVYLHDTSATAGHSAVYVAKQFLQRPEVQDLVAAVAAAPVEASAPVVDGEPVVDGYAVESEEDAR